MSCLRETANCKKQVMWPCSIYQDTVCLAHSRTNILRRKDTVVQSCSSNRGASVSVVTVFQFPRPRACSICMSQNPVFYS